MERQCGGRVDNDVVTHLPKVAANLNCSHAFFFVVRLKFFH